MNVYWDLRSLLNNDGMLDLSLSPPFGWANIDVHPGELLQLDDSKEEEEEDEDPRMVTVNEEDIEESLLVMASDVLRFRPNQNVDQDMQEENESEEDSSEQEEEEKDDIKESLAPKAGQGLPR